MTLAVDLRATFAAGGSRFGVDVDLTVEAGETVVVLGPSGSGKSLLLETVAGYHPHEGTVSTDGSSLAGVPPERRSFGFVFQDYALFPHLSVRENVSFGTRYHDGTLDPEALLERFGVGHLADRSPETLSGGEKQRVALARSLAIDPDALLLDEPLGALDVPTRRALRDDLGDALTDVTALYVTHDRTTARALADRVAVMRAGEIVQVGSPEAVFERPTSAFVARFVGSNVVDGALLSDERAARAATLVAVRPEHVRLEPDGYEAGGDDVALDGRVDRVTREEAAYRVTVSLDGAGGERVDAFVGTPPALDSAVSAVASRDRFVAVGGDG